MQAIAAGEADAVAFGKLFIANSDLPKRFALGAPLNTPDASTFYGSGPSGYADYPVRTTRPLESRQLAALHFDLDGMSGMATQFAVR